MQENQIEAREISEDAHPLPYAWTFWVAHRPPGMKSSAINYADQTKKMANFNSIESFWAVYQHMKRPQDLPTVTDIHLFREGIAPMWEDPINAEGGKWMVRVKKGLANRLWENLIIAMISGAFEDVADEICGAVLSLRQSEDIISVWNKSAESTNRNIEIRNHIKKLLQLPSDVVIEYKAHKNAMVDHSSFRNTNVFR